jgi:putative hydrolase of the HAD superfamily
MNHLEIEHVFFDIGGVLGTNGWDREQRARALVEFDLDAEDFEYRHAEVVGAFESGAMTLAEYLAITVFHCPRDYTPEDFTTFMFAQSIPHKESIAVVRALRQASDVRLATLNNEARELNEYRIQRFGLRELFDAFFTSCWLGVRKPMPAMYERVLGMTQADPRRCVFVDDREQNLGPARALGMHAIHFTSADQLARELQRLGLALVRQRRSNPTLHT